MMMSPTLVDVPMFQLFSSRFAQTHNFHIEMQFISSQWMIEVQGYSIVINIFHTCIPGLTGVIFYAQLQAFLDGHIFREFAARHIHICLSIIFTVSVRR